MGTRWTQEPWDWDVVLPPHRGRNVTEQARCPHDRSVLVDCPACPDPVRTVDEPLWLLVALLLGIVAATYGVVLLIGPGL